jgi:ureidoglycolate lyase
MSPTPESRHSRQTIGLKVEPLTKEAFAPFGVILSAQGRNRLPINTYGDKLDLYRETFETDQPIEWFIAHFRSRDPNPLFLERHHLLTQTFIPLGGKAFVSVVAAKDAPLIDGMPKLEAIKAFVVPGDTAIQLHRSTWHENPFPLESEQTLLVTSHAALTRGHQENPEASLAQLPLDLERSWFKDTSFDLRLELIGLS